ncbi:putative odorant receptor 69a isoform X3 [Apis cerana]|uniref:putative odorant receptor 69a isoform X3 n=1 Tax=Apis cerana TaxID=7461 RepID=UPI002B236F44|nr:putative odorant receptor 69a isoform X3 [Apis cerana]
MHITAILYSSLAIILFCHMSTCLLDKIQPLNETRLKKFPILTEYSILDEKYFLFTTIYLYISLLLLITIFVATESLMILWLQHAASLCEITRFLQDARDYNVITYCILLIFAITSLGINLFCLSQSILVLTKIEETIINFLCIICELSYMFYMNYMCQQVLDCSNNLIITIFHTNWYKMPVSIQKLILNIMLNCNKPYLFTFFSVYYPTIEGFASLLKMSLSYFMMILSMQ